MSEEPSNELRSLLAQANQALKLAGESLNLAVEGMPLFPDFQSQYIRQQALSVASVALDVHLLVDHERFQNVVGLCRIGFESRISIYAAMRVPDFAAQKYLAGAKGHVEELEELIRSGANSPSFQRELEHHRRLLEEMLRDMSGIQEKSWWKFQEVARAAGLMADYEAHYSMLSKATHNTPTGLAAKAAPQIVARFVLQLLNDAIQACAALVFFQMPNGKSPKPLTIHWKEMIPRIDSLQGEYGNLRSSLSQLFKEEFSE